MILFTNVYASNLGNAKVLKLCILKSNIKSAYVITYIELKCSPQFMLSIFNKK